MGALGAIHHGPLTTLLDTFIRESFTVPMLAEPNGLGNSVEESDHVMFPVPNMITDLLPQYLGTLVVRIEVHVKRIDVACAMVVDYDGAAGRSLCLASAVRLDAVKPGRITSYIVDRGQVNGMSAESIEGVEVVKIQDIGNAWNGREVVLRYSMDQLCSDVRWLVWLR